MSVLIKGGRVITAADDYVADIYIEGERITTIGESLDVSAERTIDATGKYVLPGAVDPHTHLAMPWRGETTIDDFESGQTAAAFGGTTTHVDFCIQGKGQTFGEALEIWHGKRNGKSIIDNGFHIAITDLASQERLDELATPARGARRHVLQALHGLQGLADGRRRDAVPRDAGRGRQRGARDGARGERRRDRGADGRGDRRRQHDADLPRAHAPARDRGRGDEPRDPARARRGRDAVRRARVVRRVGRADRASRARRAGTSGARPARSTSSSTSRSSTGPTSRARSTSTRRRRAPKANQEVLWNAVRTNVLQAISTDHCAYLFKGQKDAGKDDFRQIPNGGPGLENRLQMIHHFGVREGRISLNRMVELLCTNPAKLFGLYPRKGTLAVGSDADVVVFDPEKRVTISASTHHSRSDYNLYEGTEVQGSPEIVLLRGNVIVDGDQLLAKPGSGQFIKRARPDEELKPAALATA